MEDTFEALTDSKLPPPIMVITEFDPPAGKAFLKAFILN
jgi:hypothetical protein